MVIAVAVLILGVLLGALFLIPRKSGKSVFGVLSMVDVLVFLYSPCILSIDFPVVIFESLIISAVAEKSRTNAADRKKVYGVYSKAEIALHNKRTDCWIIVKDRVFDVTSYVEEHPGGDAILTNAGSDSTEGFYGPQHPGGAFQLIEDYCIGELEK